MKIEFNLPTTWQNRPQLLTRTIRTTRFLAILFAILTLVALSLLLVFLWPMITNGNSIPLLAILDELDDEIGMIFLLLCGSVVCALGSRFLKRKNLSSPQS